MLPLGQLLSCSYWYVTLMTSSALCTAAAGNRMRLVSNDWLSVLLCVLKLSVVDARRLKVLLF